MDRNGENPTPTPDQTPQKPANSGRRKLLKIIGGMLGLGVAAKAVQTAASTETGQRILNTAPNQDHSHSRPSLYKQLDEVQKNLDIQDSSKKIPPTVEPTQQKIETAIKATMDANPNNRFQKPQSTATPKK